MKQSFTYSGDPKTRRDAIRNAKKEGKNFSELIESLLTEYNKLHRLGAGMPISPNEISLAAKRFIDKM